MINSDDVPVFTIGSNQPKPFSDIDFLWYRRPFENNATPTSVGEKLRLAEIEEAMWNLMMQIPIHKWINFPTHNWMADKKATQLMLAHDCGLLTPEWVITNKVTEAKRFIEEHEWKCILKPIDCGYVTHGEQSWHIYTNELKSSDTNLSLIGLCPTLIQKRLEKAFDVRTVYLNGSTLFIGLYGGPLDVRRNEMEHIQYQILEPPSSVAEGYIHLMRKNGLRFCTSDFVVTKDGSWFFLENNPNGQWVWMDEFLEYSASNFFFANLDVQP
ncbi:hypothetical protein KBY93_05805 [Synechococcus sp. J7-Johnson]|uniref:hypothetical protein n=1 Tax=Synechococcus sp. J7-Johnson TaxID=2823737 RepID=UPI0020CFBABB|nr:hypothetical protein [Synechococcus sp. J7-Johnson]MCP9840150.1 hypothetical protein [Synechococcus sp. J7-Johnson]